MKHDDMLTILEQLIGPSAEAEAAARLAHPGLAEDLERALAEAFAAERRRAVPSLADMAAYVDGMLEGAECDAFEAAMAASPELRAEVEMLRDHKDLFEEAPDDAERNRAGEASLEGLRASFDQSLRLSPEQQRALFQDPALRAEYNRLIKVKPPLNPPVLRPNGPTLRAASSASRITSRDVPGGTLTIHSGGRPHIVLIQIQLDPGASVGRWLKLCGPDGSLGYIALPAPDDEDTIVAMLDTRKPEDATTADLITDLFATLEFDVP